MPPPSLLDFGKAPWAYFWLYEEIDMNKMFFSLGVLLLATGSIGFIQELQGQELPRLAVVEFDTNINIPKVNQDAVTVRNLVESQMVGTRQYQVITRTDIDRLLANQQIQVSSIGSAENIRKLQLQNISYIVTGSVNAMDNDYLITVKMLDVSTGQFSHSADTFTGSGSRDLYNGVTQLIKSFTSGMTSQGGQVAQTASAPAKSNAALSVEDALAKAAEQTLRNVTQRSRIAIVYITAQDRSMTDYIVGELEIILINGGFSVITRISVDEVRREQGFQMSDEIDDMAALHIGNMLGANIIVTGKINGEGSLRRLRLRALDTQTAQVVGAASETF
jgi:TolB-like protein